MMLIPRALGDACVQGGVFEARSMKHEMRVMIDFEGLGPISGTL
jgi:hypothetical protein